MIKWLSGLLPSIDWLVNYKARYLKFDLIAGLTVGILLVPQGMAYAMLAGLDPVHGLYASTIPLIIYVLFGTSRHLAVGPVAIVSLLTASGVGSLQPESYSDYLMYTVTLAFMVGFFQVLMGMLKMGFISNFLSNPVIIGFTSAAAVIIGLSQLRHLLGVDIAASDRIHEILVDVVANFSDIHWLTALVGVGGIITIRYAYKLRRGMPGALAAMVLGILVAGPLGLADSGVQVIGEVKAGFGGLSLPALEGGVLVQLLPIALTITLIGFAESYAVAKTIQSRRKNYQLDSNKELVGLGMANFASAFLKGIPVTGSFSRTAINAHIGGRTGMSAIFSALLVIGTIFFFTSLFYYLPNAILAAVIIVAVVGLINIREPVKLWKKDRADFLLLIVTFVSTLFGGIEIGIVIGLLLSIVLVVFRASVPHMAKLGRVPGTNLYRNTERFSDLEESDEILIFRIDGPLYFANLDFVKSRIDEWMREKGEDLSMLVFNAHTLTSIDSSAAHALQDWILDWRRRNLEIYITGARGPVRDKLDRWNITNKVGVDNTFSSNEHLFMAKAGKIDKQDKKKLDKYALQSNPKKKLL
ncbi:MAG: solute carrier 26 family protein [Saprospirales bacterium]|nr:MAG: solute carrier 26 family protein [Saprospirales bacterium]